MIKHITTQKDCHNSQSTHLLNFSGGFDSTYYLYKALQDSDQKILLHHCKFSKKREPEESNACQNIINYFPTHHHRLEYVETEYSRKGIQGKILDLLPLHCMTGILLINGYPNLQHIYKPTCFNDIQKDQDLIQWLQQGNTYHSYNGPPTSRRTKIKQLIQTLSDRNLEWLMPHWNKTKFEMITELPKELAQLVHYCRQKKNQKQPCEKCHACRWSKKGREFHGL